MLKKLITVGAVTAGAVGFTLVGGPANASINTVGSRGVLSGNQVVVPVSVPVNVCGNAVAVLGFAGAGCKGGASVGRGFRHHHHHHHHCHPCRHHRHHYCRHGS